MTTLLIQKARSLPCERWDEVLNMAEKASTKEEADELNSIAFSMYNREECEFD